MNAKRIARPLVACIALMIGLVGCGGSTDPAGSAAPGSSQGLDAKCDTRPARRGLVPRSGLSPSIVFRSPRAS